MGVFDSLGISIDLLTWGLDLWGLILKEVTFILGYCSIIGSGTSSFNRFSVEYSYDCYL